MINFLVTYGILLPMAIILWLGLIAGALVTARVVLTQILEVYYFRKDKIEQQSRGKGDGRI